MTEQDLREKREIYRSLDSTTDEDDDAPDPGWLSSVTAMKKTSSRTARAEQGASGLGRSLSDSNVISQYRDRSRALRPEANNRPSSSAGVPPTLQSRHTMPSVPVNRTSDEVAPSAPPTKKTTGKRKRNDEPQQLPVTQQVLAGLTCYFFPNNDKNPARKARIAKAIEFGAVWTCEFTEDVTHVIVDKNLEYGQLLKYIKRETLPPNVVVVSEDYPAECISFRQILVPVSSRFKVKGYTISNEQQTKSFQSDKSLQLKPAGKYVTAQEPETANTSVRSSPLTSGDFTNQASTTAALVTAAPSNVSAGTKINSTDEFDALIRQARELRFAPLDADDELASRPTSSGGPDTDDETSKDQPGKKKNSKFQTFQDKFQCMQKHTGQNSESPNAQTIAILQQMADYYSQVGDEWRPRAYRKAISTLRTHPVKVWTKEQALALPNVGERLAIKIEEIASTNRLRRLENAKAEPSDQIFQAFMQIYGVGPVQASKWIEAGYRTIDEVRKKAKLSENQRIGIQHYDDFNTRIPRAEVAKHGEIVKKALQGIDPAFQVIIGGSYRRGSPTSGDIDCILTRPDTGSGYIREVVLEQLVPKLVAQKFLVAALASTSKDDGSKWHGASQLSSTRLDAAPNPWRRIDLLLVPSDELGAALIYFSGDDIFNRSMRLLAGTKGMRLNQRGLYKDVIRGKGREKLSEGILVEGKDERKIFEILGVPWRPPEHRIC